MSLWFAALMGLVQGLTEFLPISSTAHLRIVPALLGKADAGASFTAVIQLGTLLAVILYFARDLGRMARDLIVDRTSHPARLAFYVVVGTIPIGLAGVLLRGYVKGPLRSLWVVTAALVVVALILYIADRAARQERSLEGLTLRDALIIGLAQACALVPGVSRSGATIAAALIIGLRRDDAARFSFLLSIPAIGAAGVFEIPAAIRTLQASGAGLLPLLVGTVVAGVTGYASIAWLIRHLQTRGLTGFVVYRIVLGMVLAGLLLGGVLHATT